MKKGTVSTIITMVLLVVVLVIILISLIFGLIPTTYEEALDSIKYINTFFDEFLKIISGKNDVLLEQKRVECVGGLDDFVSAYEKCFTSSKKDCICPSQLDKSKFTDKFSIKIEKIGDNIYFESIELKEINKFLIKDANILNVGRHYPCVYDFKNDHFELIEEMEIVFEDGEIKVKALNKNFLSNTFFIADHILYKDVSKNVCFVRYIPPTPFLDVGTDKLASKTYC